jgi:hypothetical protein
MTMQKQRVASPLAYQRRASQWLDLVRRSAIDEGILPLAVYGETVDPLGALRSVINARNGSLLRVLDTMRGLRQDLPAFSDSGEALLTGMELAPRAARHLLGEALPLRRSAYWRVSDAIERAHVWRVLARRVFDAVATHRADEAPRSIPMLMLVRESGHVRDLLPVARQLRDRHGIPSLFCLLRPSLRSEVESAGIAVTSIYDWAGGRAAGAIGVTRRLSRDLARVDVSAHVQELAIDAWTHRALMESTLSLLRAHMPGVLSCISGLVGLLANHPVRLLAVGNPYTAEGRVAIDAARGRGIPTVAVEHGTIFPNDARWEDCNLDRMCVWGAPSRDVLLQNGLRPDQVLVSGAPHLDEQIANVTAARSRSAGSARVLVATSGPGDSVAHDEHMRFVRLLRDAIESSPDLSWTIKLHRKDLREFYTEAGLTAALGVNLIEATDGAPDIFHYLQSADVLLTVTSTTALDALISGVPVITVDLGHRDGPEYLRRGCTVSVTTSGQLLDAARSLARGQIPSAIGESAEAYRREHFANLGRASEVAADAFASLMRAERPPATSTAA